MSLFESASLVVTPNGTKASKLYAIKPTDGSGDLSVVRATTATRVNSDGLIESVATNVPRLDYTNGSCPSILVEPQRTNLFLNSVFSGSGTFPTSWSTSIATGTSFPIASTKSTLVQAYIFTTSSSRQAMYQNQSYVSGNKYAVSIYVENVVGNIEVSNMILQLGTGTTIYYKNGQEILNTDFIESGNIYSSVLSATASSTSQIRIGNGCGGNTTGSIILSMPQFEAGATATSYIPTVSSAVTRNADVISKTGISDLIGQTEGTIFVDAKTFINPVDFSSLRRCYLILTDGTFSNRIEISKFGSNNILLNNDIKVRISSSGTTIFDQTVATNYSGNLKLALAYKNGSTIVYINGVNVYEYNTAFTVPNTSVLNLGDGYSQPTADSLNYISIWKTALTDSELATLTTI